MSDVQATPAAVITFWYSNLDVIAPHLANLPQPDQHFGRRLVAELYPAHPVVSTGAFALQPSAPPGPAELYVGAFPGLTVVRTGTLDVDRPSRLPEQWVTAMQSDTLLVQGHDRRTASWFFGRWEDGAPVRLFAATAHDVVEDEGMPRPWESPFWGADGSDTPAGALPFRPEAMVAAAAVTWLGFDPAEAPEVPVYGFATDGRRPVRTPEAPPRGRTTPAEDTDGDYWDVATPGRGEVSPLVEAPHNVPGAVSRPPGPMSRLLDRLGIRR